MLVLPLYNSDSSGIRWQDWGDNLTSLKAARQTRNSPETPEKIAYLPLRRFIHICA